MLTAPFPVRHGAGFSDEEPAVYCDALAPADGAERGTVVMVHGGAHTGSCYLATPDGRPGWAYDFVARGYRVVVPDWPGVGRSGAVAPDQLDAETVCRGLAGVVRAQGGPVVLVTHSMGGALGWRVVELASSLITAVVAFAPGPPGNIQPEPEVLEATANEVLVRTPHRILRLPRHGSMPNDRAMVEDKLIGRGSRFFPRGHAARYAASLQPVPSRLLQQRLNIDGAQVRVADTGCFRGKPVLVVTGTEDLEHPRATDEEIVLWLRGCGAEAEFLYLGDRGVTGNGHMLMLEANSAAIAGLAVDWLQAALSPSAR